MTVAESQGWGWIKAVSPSEQEELQKKWVQSCILREGFELEARIMRGSDKTYRWHLVRGVPVPVGSSGFLAKVNENNIMGFYSFLSKVVWHSNGH